MQTIGNASDSVAAIAKHLAARPIAEPAKPVRVHSLADLGAALADQAAAGASPAEAEAGKGGE